MIEAKLNCQFPRMFFTRKKHFTIFPYNYIKLGIPESSVKISLQPLAEFSWESQNNVHVYFLPSPSENVHSYQDNIAQQLKGMTRAHHTLCSMVMKSKQFIVFFNNNRNTITEVRAPENPQRISPFPELILCFSATIKSYYPESVTE